MPHTYEYPRPALTVDCVVFGWSDPGMSVLLIQRDLGPFEGMWALPGGFVHEGEPLEQAAGRELEEETGMADVYLEQLCTMGQPGRDPRGWVVSVAFFALLCRKEDDLRASTDARDARWFALDNLPELAFDHKEIYRVARERLRSKIHYQPVCFELLPEKFSLSQFQRLYETIDGKEVDKRNFRKKLRTMTYKGKNLFTELDEVEEGKPHRAGKLFRFEKETYKTLEKEGFEFKI